MSTRTALLALAVVLAGCSGAETTRADEVGAGADPFAEFPAVAEPSVAAAARSAEGLSDYLRASGVGHRMRWTGRTPNAHYSRQSATWVRLDFDQGGFCDVGVFPDVATAAQEAPRNGGPSVCRVRYLPGGQAEARWRIQYKPTYRFGRVVAACTRERGLAARSLRALHAAAQPVDA